MLSEAQYRKLEPLLPSHEGESTALIVTFFHDFLTILAALVQKAFRLGCRPPPPCCVVPALMTWSKLSLPPVT